jgi:carbamoyl-phosphate synthase/aspartate carbamoyltransferase/dihydroorotase
LYQTLSDWLKANDVPGISGIDTRELTKKIREKGSILGKLIMGLNVPSDITFSDPNLRNLVSEVSIKVPIFI